MFILKIYENNGIFPKIVTRSHFDITILAGIGNGNAIILHFFVDLPIMCFEHKNQT